MVTSIAKSRGAQLFSKKVRSDAARNGPGGRSLSFTSQSQAPQDTASLLKIALQRFRRLVSFKRSDVLCKEIAILFLILHSSFGVRRSRHSVLLLP